MGEIESQWIKDKLKPQTVRCGHPSANFFFKDLSQNPHPDVKRGRVSTNDGSLPTFTTSSGLLLLDKFHVFGIFWHFCLWNSFAPNIKKRHTFFLATKRETFSWPRWSQEHCRPLMGTEMMAAMGMPCTESLAHGCSSPTVDLGKLKNSAKVGRVSLFFFRKLLQTSTNIQK